MVSYCPTCHQLLPLDLPPELDFHLPPKRRQLFELIYKAGARGISTERLVELIYGDDPNGGPEDPANVIAIMVNRINSRLRPRGWHITGKSPHRQGLYVLEKIVATPEIAVSTIREVCP